MIDSHENLTDQDLHVLAYILEDGRAIVIAINKWDGLDDYARSQIKTTLERKLNFIDYAKIFFISAVVSAIFFSSSIATRMKFK